MTDSSAQPTPALRAFAPGYFWVRDGVLFGGDEGAAFRSGSLDAARCAELTVMIVAARFKLQCAEVPGVQSWMPWKRVVN